MHRIIAFGLLLVSAGCLSARGYYQLSPLVRTAYLQVTSLQKQEALLSIAKLKRSEPGNLMVYHLENYLDFFEIYISEDESLYRARLANRDRRLLAVAGGEPRSPYHLYVQAEIRLHWALLRFRFGDYWAAFTDINQAYRLLLRNQSRFPDFIGNLKDLGILHAAVGTVPDEYRWALQLVSSLEGTVGQGKREIERLLAQTRTTDYLYLQETKVLYAFLLLHLDNRPELAWQAISNAGLDPAVNPLHCFVMANIAMRTGRNDQALQWLRQRPAGSQFVPFPFLHYMTGLAKLRRLDTSAAADFRLFVRQGRGRHYIKETYQKLGWCELLLGNPTGYRQYMQLVKSQGYDSAGGDKNALREATQANVPQLTLLEARLLFDGGYYARAEAKLAEVDKGELSSDDQLEFTYRRGRVLQGLQRWDEAIRLYDEVIAVGAKHPASYACNAALQAGLIHEQRGRTGAAKVYYNHCLRIHPFDHATALHQQAKAGLSRLQ